MAGIIPILLVIALSINELNTQSECRMDFKNYDQVYILYKGCILDLKAQIG